jgi:hypothetical protein
VDADARAVARDHVATNLRERGVDRDFDAVVRDDEPFERSGRVVDVEDADVEIADTTVAKDA